MNDCSSSDTSPFRLSVRGPMTVSCRPTLEATLINAMRRHKRLEVDLSGVLEIDLYGVHLLGLLRNFGATLILSPVVEEAARRFELRPEHPPGQDRPSRSRGGRLLMRASGEEGKTVNRRRDERFDVSSVFFCATWLEERKTVKENGTLIDISNGGFSVGMRKAPPNGRLLHVRFALDTLSGEAGMPIEAVVRVCHRRPGALEGGGQWTVHFAIELMDVRDEWRMASALGILQGAGWQSG